MDLSDLSKLRVVDLKQELQNRGLDTKGVKAVLISRLQAAIDEAAEAGKCAHFLRGRQKNASTP